MTNRFDTSQQQQYVSSYVPLPFETIGALGAKMTQEHAAKQAEADALADQLNKIKVSNQVLSEGSGEDLGIKYRNTGYGDFKNQVLNKYTLANKQLADDYQAGKLDAGQFAQKVGQLKSDFNGDYQKLKIAEVNSAAIEEADKKYRDAKQAGASPFILNKLAEEGSRLLSNPYGNEYKGAPIGEALDVEDVKNKYADKFKSQIFSSGAGRKDANGMIIYTDKSGVTKQRVIDSVNSTFENDLIGAQTREQTNRFLRDRGLDWDSEVTLQDGSKVKAGDYYYDSLKQDFVNGVVAKAESSELKKQIKQDWILKDQMRAAAEDKKATDALNLKGNAIPGSTVDVLASDKDFQNLSTKGILSVGTDGKVNINWDNLSSGTVYDIRDVSGKVISSTYDYAEAENQRKASNGAISSITPRKIDGVNTENSTELRNFITKAAKAVGFDDDYIAKLKRGEIAGQSWSGQMQNIATAYNVLSKSKLGGVQLPSDVQEIESQRVMNSPESYTVYDATTHNPTGTVLNKGDIVKTGERIYIDGQAFNKSIIQRQVKGQDPVTEEVLLKPQSKNSQDYFDRGLGSTQKAVMDLYVSGGKPDPKNIENYDPKTDKGEIATVFARGTLSNEDKAKVSYTFVRDNKNLNNQKYILHTPEGDLKFNDYNEFLVHADAAYYLYGRGKADATSLKNKFKFERVQESTLSNDNQDNED